MEQNYKNHAMIDPLFHFVLAPFTILAVVLSLVHFFTDYSFTAIIIALMSVVLFMFIVKLRLYALQLQDRVIRAEEQFRYYVLTGNRLDSRVTTKQLIALRFASDDEFPGLVKRAAEESLSPDQIKRSVENWRADHERV